VRHRLGKPIEIVAALLKSLHFALELQNAGVRIHRLPESGESDRAGVRNRRRLVPRVAAPDGSLMHGWIVVSTG
jgi:hypothetical protein